MNRSPLFECQNGADRRAWLRTLGWQVRPTVRRFLRRAWRAVTPPIAFVGKWVGIGALIAAGVVLTLALIAEAFRSDPLTPSESVKKPVSAPAAQPLRRMT